MQMLHYMAVDILIVAGYSSTPIAQATWSLNISFSSARKHIDCLTPDHPAGVIKKGRSGQITMEFSQKFIDNLLGLFKAASKVITNGVKIPLVPKEGQGKRDKESHSCHNSEQRQGMR